MWGGKSQSARPRRTFALLRRHCVAQMVDLAGCRRPRSALARFCLPIYRGASPPVPTKDAPKLSADLHPVDRWVSSLALLRSPHQARYVVLPRRIEARRRRTRCCSSSTLGINTDGSTPLTSTIPSSWSRTVIPLGSRVWFRRFNCSRASSRRSSSWSCWFSWD